MAKTRSRSTREKLRAQLGALNEATLAITAELALDRLLQRIVHLARELVNARYAALGIPDGQGGLEQFLTSGLTEQQTADEILPPPEGQEWLGALMHFNKPTRLRCISDDPHLAGLKDHYPCMTSFLGVPITSKGNLLGILYLANKIGADEFSEDDEQLVVMLASHAAIAIENARLYQQVQQLAVLEERQRIGMDLHDGIIQSIYAVGLMLEYCNLLLDEDPSTAKSQLNQAIAKLNEVIRDIRSYILDLRPQRFQGKDLPGGLFELIRSFRANTLIQTDLQVEAEGDIGLTQAQASGLFHIAQEALANVAKHARARQVTVILARDQGRVTLTVQDDGRGFDMSHVTPYEGHGLRNMEARARLLGGRLTVDSAIGRGTTIKVTVPIEPIGGRGT